jgi:endonuclease/exonuclease/phosphatase family metal-dependent hydrolase
MSTTVDLIGERVVPHARLVDVLRVLVWVLGVVLALPAVTLTLARLSGSERQTAVQVQAFAPLAVPLYAGLVVLLVAVGVSSGVRLVPVAAAVAAALLLAVHVAWVAPLMRAEAAPAGGRLTVMTSNLRIGRADMEAVLAAARENDVDLLALEEVRPAALRRLDAAGVSEVFPYRIGESTGTVVLSRTPLTAATRILGGNDSWAVTWRGRRVFAVHPAYPRRNAAWRGELSALAVLAARDRPALMLGDFNATQDHRPFRVILRAGYRDAAEQAGSGWQPTWPVRGTARPFGLPLPPSVAIDHVLLGDGLVATSTRTVVVGGTDHKSLVATLVDSTGS